MSFHGVHAMLSASFLYPAYKKEYKNSAGIHTAASIFSYLNHSEPGM